MSRATSRTAGCRATVVIDRDTASRFGITPQLIDDTLYDAFGQRQVSTMFTQLNQYHVVLEVDAGVSAESADRSDSIYVPIVARRSQVPLSRRSRTSRHRSRRRSSINHQGQFPVGDALVQSGAGRVAGRRGQGDRTARSADIGLPPSIQAEFPGNRAGVPGFARERAAADSGGARSRSTSCSACSTRATSIRSRFSRRCRRPASGALLAL